MENLASERVTSHSFTKFSSPEGTAFCRNIASKHCLPWDPHDYQLEGVCKALDGIDVFAITPTGSGKTGFLLIYMLVAQAIAKDRELCPKGLRSRFKADPCMVVVCPTKSLEHDMEPKFKAAGLTTVVINADTTRAAQAAKVDLWSTAQSKTAVILLSPEQLTSRPFQRLTSDKTFAARIMALNVDEAHLLCFWGTRFRTAFLHIGHVRVRLPTTPVLIALTATIYAGSQMDMVCHSLGLHTGQYHLIRRSNARYDIRWLFRIAQAGAKSKEFTDLDWTIQTNPGRRVVVFCKTIALCHRVASYLRDEATSLPNCKDRIRPFTSMCGDDYNRRTLALLRDTSVSGLQVTVGTDTMAFGLDGVTDDVVSFGHIPDDLNLMLQRAGRIRDGRGRDARAIVYLPRTAVERATMALGLGGSVASLSKKRKASALDESDTIDPLVARVILAKCKVDEINAIYENPENDVPCTCRTCTSRVPLTRPSPCNCSGCQPENHSEVCEQSKGSTEGLQVGVLPDGEARAPPRVQKRRRKAGVC
ncbi:P-loop containing nucleoside triphosphate hydrolase protein [Fomitopsis serialis]|uniref:P-loop containing nucleoside triphosphate hydrolase protein n=1 Tax=Fomitopsis serialis TaxID=139415 RepID=UPI002007D228|nr:P-loop containing nucleoside triphosphate hydrolase protein [Neoantrodia serialis]KAH9911495.1 P-loop containing nucleoside triphosphate hydrolase protein [Neoantrodia serialis]